MMEMIGRNKLPRMAKSVNEVLLMTTFCQQTENDI